MYTVFLAGGIASGKSTVARELERLGCHRIDLDDLSRSVLAPGSATLAQVAAAFGADIVDPATGALNRQLLAARAFATPETAALLEQIELPAIRALLEEELARVRTSANASRICLVEVPLLDRMPDAHSLADEVLVVSCPKELRRRRAIGRGMTGADFDARVANQPSDAWLEAHADTVLANLGTPEELLAQVRAWYGARVGEGRT